MPWNEWLSGFVGLSCSPLLPPQLTGAARCFKKQSCTSGPRLCSSTLSLFKTCRPFAHCRIMWTACWSMMLLRFVELIKFEPTTGIFIFFLSILATWSYLYLVWTSFSGLNKALSIQFWPLCVMSTSFWGFAKLTAFQIVTGCNYSAIWTKHYKNKNVFSFCCAYLYKSICHRSLYHMSLILIWPWKCSLGNILFREWNTQRRTDTE